ncbi:hypothetical protein PtrSN002B_007472 [Pyrenophora tritici-repentis]|uniref:Uncharacterized protein n=2 Tax=Pyrenophora tritici-repentis TaxID=45151 RepID=A0A2W1ELX4_9PLEO|nr:uncharacterized protein PTRG_06478 [Pyrenophora tritici-repentis Pt-1C-BFP]KAA8613560.1 hypothetical protein PtrV1_12468 [Pyrenophora tritici-repentis]EDU49398.1 predicted protein [Pyrenophora tritici-repentis Pt-1C-BFP]KAF7445270.1 hypothetical protein A1F99_102560 [Pyrenophora tritici-repentis]KAF7565535.1 hypothetical protein PtrM4_049690 [Pyrenophora tritici-repentis]KAG9380337.1 hypothetical protein A1F94_009232 [Pyrenophora tritici-repentis]
MSLPAPATRASDLNDADMARLSAPANETPKTERKSNRFRSMFKHRPDSSASSSPATSTKAQHADSSPLSSPTVKPGFQQIGLLPCERPSSSSQVNAEMVYLDSIDIDQSAIMEERDEEVGPVMTHDEKTESVIKTASPKIIDFALPTLNDAKYHSSSPHDSPGKLTDNMYADTNPTDAKSEIVGDKKPLKSFLPPKPDDPKRQNQSLGPEQNKNTDMLDFDDLLDRCRTSLKIAHDNYNSLKLSNSVADYDDDSIASDSSSVKAAKEDLLLRARYRELGEFIRKQITMAMGEHHGNHHGAESEKTTAACVTINIDLGGASTAKAMQVVSVRSDNALFAVNSTIGPFTLTHAHIARDLQLSIVAFYVILLLGSAFLGPKTLALTVWRMAIVLGVYAAAVCHLGWTERLECDVLLAPMFFAFSVAQGLFAQMSAHIHVVVAGAVADGLRRNGTGEEGRVDDK